MIVGSRELSLCVAFSRPGPTKSPIWVDWWSLGCTLSCAISEERKIRQAFPGRWRNLRCLRFIDFGTELAVVGTVESVSFIFVSECALLPQLSVRACACARHCRIAGILRAFEWCSGGGFFEILAAETNGNSQNIWSRISNQVSVHQKCLCGNARKRTIENWNFLHDICFHAELFGMDGCNAVLSTMSKHWTRYAKSTTYLRWSLWQ